MYSVTLLFNGKSEYIQILSGTVTYDLHGDAVCTFTMPYLPRYAQLIALTQQAQVIVTKWGETIWSGRVENVELNDRVLTVVAYGKNSTIDDTGNTISAIFSMSDARAMKVQNEGYSAVLPTDAAKIGYDTLKLDTARTTIFLEENNSVLNNEQHGYFVRSPDAYSISGLQMFLDVEFRLPNGFITYINSANSGVRSENIANETTAVVVSASGVLNRFMYSSVLDGAQAGLTINTRNSTGGTYTSTEDNGFWYSRVKNMRLVNPNTSVSGTVSTAVTVSGTYSFTPNVITGIYPGQLLRLEDGWRGELVRVSNVYETTFTAFCERPHSGTYSFYAPVLTTSAIVSRLMAGEQQSITATAQDVPDAVYAYATKRSILEDMAARGDGDQVYTYGYSGDTFFFKPKRGDTIYYADIDSYQLNTKLSALHNSVYGLYTDVYGVDRIGSIETDTNSISTYGITRRTAVKYDTTASGIAQKYASESPGGD